MRARRKQFSEIDNDPVFELWARDDDEDEDDDDSESHRRVRRALLYLQSSSNLIKFRRASLLWNRYVIRMKFLMRGKLSKVSAIKSK